MRESEIRKYDIYHVPGKGTGEVLRADWAEGDVLLRSVKGNNIECCIEALRPVAITEDFLNRNGFEFYEQEGSEVWHLTDDVSTWQISLIPQTTMIPALGGRGYHLRIKVGKMKRLRIWPIYSVHELQHAMVECGINCVFEW